MLASSISFSVRDILNENQQVATMDCYGNHQQVPHMTQDFYGYNTLQENHWDIDKFKEQQQQQTQMIYHGYQDLNHVNTLGHMAAQYQESAVVEDGKLQKK